MRKYKFQVGHYVCFKLRWDYLIVRADTFRDAFVEATQTAIDKYKLGVESIAFVMEEKDND